MEPEGSYLLQETRPGYWLKPEISVLPRGLGSGGLGVYGPGLRV